MLNNTALASIQTLLTEKTGLLIDNGHLNYLHEAIAARMTALNFPSEQAYYQYLSKGETEWQALAEKLTINESYFFRDEGHFKLLKTEILPQLIQQNQQTKYLNIWSAGCAAGEEPYSIAILINELLPQPNPWTINILGTDISYEMIKKAKQGLYSPPALRRLDTSILNKYFKPINNQWQLNKNIMDMVKFYPSNLVKQASGKENTLAYFDLIICRHVFIYFAQKMTHYIADYFTQSLNTQGYLMIGHTELEHYHNPLLEAKIYPNALIYKKILKNNKKYNTISTSDLTKKAPLISQKTSYKKKAILAFNTTNTTQSIEELCQLAEQYADQGKYALAEKYLMQVLEKDSYYAKAYYLLALLAQYKNELFNAKQLLNKTIYLNKDYIAAYFNLAIIYQTEGQIELSQQYKNIMLDILKKLPDDTIIPHYEPMNAKQLIANLEGIDETS